MFTFAAFEPGWIYGYHRFVVSDQIVAAWREEFGYGEGNPDLMPPGMTSLIQQHAYFAVVTPRPPGNIHASQRVTMHRVPKIGERLITEVRCCGKEVRKERHFVYLGFRTRDAAEELVLESAMTSLVAR